MRDLEAIAEHPVREDIPDLIAEIKRLRALVRPATESRTGRSTGKSSGPLPFHRARAVDIRFGKYKGMTLEQIAEIDITYLDWLIGQDWCRDFMRNAILGFLADPTQAKLLREALERKEEGGEGDGRKDQEPGGESGEPVEAPFEDEGGKPRF